MNNKAKYRGNKELLQQLPLFFQPWWLDVLCRDWDVALVEKEGKVIAVFPYQIEKKATLKLLRNPPLCPYLGPVFLFQADSEKKQWEQEEEAIQALWAQLPHRDYLHFTTPPGFNNFLPFHQCGCQNTNRLTSLIDLKLSEAEIVQNIQPRLRSTIRKAEKELRIVEDEQPDVTIFMNWQQQAFHQKKNTYPYRYEMLNNIIHTAEKHESSCFQTAYDAQNRPVAMLWTPFDQKSSYYLLAAKHPKDKHNGAMALLIRNAIKVAKAKKLTTFDFEGSMDKGIENFFRKFGGERKSYLIFEQNKSLLWKLRQSLLS